MISRRAVLRAGIVAASGVVGAPFVRRAWADQVLRPTPTQPAGPFYPVAIPAEHDPDLARVGGTPDADGDIVQLIGSVRRTDGVAIPGAQVEIWQCDAHGIYHHVDERQGGEADRGFQGYGMAMTDAAGAYRFRTIRPVPYPGRTPHIHVMVQGPGLRRLVTQVYVAGFPTNARDFLFSRLEPDEQVLLSVDFRDSQESEADARVGRFDLVVEPA